MNDRPVIIFGLIVGAVLLTFPLWYSLAAGGSAAAPDVQVPEGRCVEDVEYMKANHMDLLNQWRDAVVRGDPVTHPGRSIDNKTYVSKLDGTHYEMSLTKTCVEQCHAGADKQPGEGQAASAAGVHAATSRATFCHTCHDYANVRPTCWDCHVEPQGE